MPLPSPDPPRTGSPVSDPAQYLHAARRFAPSGALGAPLWFMGSIHDSRPMLEVFTIRGGGLTASTYPVRHRIIRRHAADFGRGMGAEEWGAGVLIPLPPFPCCFSFRAPDLFGRQPLGRRLARVLGHERRNFSFTPSPVSKTKKTTGSVHGVDMGFANP